MRSAQDWIRHLALVRHPEGGWYCETYRSAHSFAAQALPAGFTGARVAATAIYYLLETGDFSAFHRIRSDEIWHWYGGSGAVIHCLDPDGTYTRLPLGSELTLGERPQIVVKAGTWFAAEVADGGRYVLVGCTVSPGFDFRDFELADPAALAGQYPAQRLLVERLTRPPN